MAKTIKITIEDEKPKKGQGKKKRPPGRPLKCAFCGGKGIDPQLFGLPCRACGGDGRVPPERKKKCPRCNNKGRDPITFGPCIGCHGLGYIK